MDVHNLKDTAAATMMLQAMIMAMVTGMAQVMDRQASLLQLGLSLTASTHSLAYRFVASM